MPTPCWLKHLCSIRAWVPMSVYLSVFLSLSLSLSVCVCVCVCISGWFSGAFWLIPCSMKAGCVTQGILASFLLSLSHRQLRTTRFWSNNLFGQYIDVWKTKSPGFFFIFIFRNCKGTIITWWCSVTCKTAYGLLPDFVVNFLWVNILSFHYNQIIQSCIFWCTFNIFIYSFYLLFLFIIYYYF